MRDPNNFPKPEQFLPDRYDGENPNYKAAAYIPFGDGPRSCIGKTKFFFLILELIDFHSVFRGAQVFEWGKLLRKLL